MPMRTSSRTSHTARGFTLVELIVSVALFVIVVTIAMSAYIFMISLERKARATNDVVANLSFVVNSMSRTIRTGNTYRCNGSGDCWPGGGTSFSFFDENGFTNTYFYDAASKSIYGCVNVVGCNINNATRLVDPRINVSSLMFYTQGTTPFSSGDQVQPRVIFTVTGSITPDPDSAPITFTLESMATQRLLDL